MSTLDWTILAGYLGLLIALGGWFARRQRSNEEYFVGNRGMNWFTVGLSLFSTGFSPLFFIGLPAESAYHDYHFYVAILLIPLAVVPIVGWLFIPFYQGLRLTSAYEYLERRFNRPVRLFASAIFALYMFGWMGDILYVIGVMLQALLGWTETEAAWTLAGIGLFVTLYATLGGFQGTVWADTVQSLVLAVCIVVLLIGAVSRVDGGIAAVWRLAAENDKLRMFDLHFDLSRRNNFYAACAYAFFVYLSFFATAQKSVQRYVSTPSVAAARRSLALGGIAMAAVCLLFFLLGTCIFAFYRQAHGFPKLPTEDYLVLYFVQRELPYAGLLGLLVAGLLGAACSCTSGGINSLAAALLCDWFPGEHRSVRASRLATFLVGLGVIAAALLVPMLARNVFDILLKIAGTCFGLLLGHFLLGILVPRANSGGAVVGLLAGWVALACATQGAISHWWYGAVTCLPTFFLGGLASLCWPAPRAEKLHGLILWRRAERAYSSYK